MPDIKTVTHQAAHSIQPETSAVSDKSADNIQQSKTEEAPALTKKQKEELKQSRNAESKFGELAMQAKTTSQMRSNAYELEKNNSHKDAHTTEESRLKEALGSNVVKDITKNSSGPNVLDDRVKAPDQKTNNPMDYLKPIRGEDPGKIKEGIKDVVRGAQKAYEDIAGVSSDHNKEVDKLNSDGDTYKYGIGYGQGVVGGHQSSYEVEVKQVGTPPDKVSYEMSVSGGQAVHAEAGSPGVSAGASVKTETKTTFRFDSKEDLKEGMKHLSNIQQREATFILESPKAMDERDKRMGVDKAVAFLKNHRSSIEWRGGVDAGVKAGTEGVKVGAGVKGESVKGVRLTFPNPPDEPNAKVTVLSEKTVSASAEAGFGKEGGAKVGNEVNGEIKVTTEKTYDVPGDSEFLNGPNSDAGKAMDAVKREGKLTEQKVQVQGKISKSDKFGVGDGEAGTNQSKEYGFDLEVNLPPGQKLPDDFYERLAKGDIPGAVRNMEDGEYNLKAYSTEKHGYDFEPEFSWEGFWGKGKIQHQRLDQETLGKEEGKLSKLQDDWNEMLRRMKEAS